MTDHCNEMTNMLYQLFTSQVFFPAKKQDRYCDALVRLGYAEPVNQGYANGYRISPDGFKVAHARWGHEQRSAS